MRAWSNGVIPDGLVEYIDHQSWRCDHPERYPQDEDCPCGLLSMLDELGIDPTPWRRKS